MHTADYYFKKWSVYSPYSREYKQVGIADDSTEVFREFIYPLKCCTKILCNEQ